MARTIRKWITLSALTAVAVGLLLLGFYNLPGDRWLRECAATPTCATEVGLSDPPATMNP